ncbi:aminoglycoside phosphotransferase family protein [Streptomyces sp. NPDC050145]|uniref:aminoglycoside phosphotransferase family protein n=1 Tax=Streptomyces sp. NPDC050145 TaxID=3365602 RepID=UPI00379A9E12
MTTADELASPPPVIDTALVRRLVDRQFPQWAALPLTPVDPGGSDHVIHRLGPDLAVRLPRRADVRGQADKESAWLPRLAPHLPLAVPVPVAVGRPGLGYPFPWAVARWLDGRTATVEEVGGSTRGARQLAGFLRALQSAAPPVDRSGLSGETLGERDAGTRRAIARFAHVFDAPAMTQLWEAALAAPPRATGPVWFHGDFHTGNLLTVDGRISAVIDFGGLGFGDPAVDLMVAFTLLSPPARAVFRTALGTDDATWLRGRGWALTTGLSAYAAYAGSSPAIAAQTARQIRAALAG